MLNKSCRIGKIITYEVGEGPREAGACQVMSVAIVLASGRLICKASRQILS